MALDKNIKGITIEIGGSTDKLNKALNDVNKESRELQKELGTVEKLLKFDPGNTELLIQQQKLLETQIEASKNKVEALRQAQEKVNDLLSSGKIDDSQYRAFERQLIIAEQQLKNTEARLEANQKALNGFGDAAEESVDKLKQNENAVEDYDKAIKNASESTLTFGDLLKSNIAGDLIADGLRDAAGAAKEYISASIEIAGNAKKAQEAVDVTFENSNAVITKWAESSAQSYGISSLAAKQYTNDIGGLIKSFEITADKAADMSVNMVGLAGDLASFHNRDVQEAFDKIRAGIEGDVESLKDFSINMSEANLEAYAFSQGIKTAYSEMSEAEQVQLRYNFLLETTSKIQGNFTKTSNDTVNQQKILKANIENMAASLGEKLQPRVNDVLVTVNNKLPALEPKLEKIGELISEITEFALDNSDAIISMAAGYAAFTGANAIGNGIMAVVESLKSLKAANDAATVSQNAMNAAAKANPYVLIASLVTAAAVAMITYANAADTACNRIKNINKEIDSLNQATEESIKTTEGEIAVLENKAAKYEELRVKANRTAGEEQQLLELAKELQQYMPEGTILINEQTGAYNSLAGSINSVTEAMKVNAYISAYKEEYEGLTKQLIEAKKEHEELANKIANKNAAELALDSTLRMRFNIGDLKAYEDAEKTIEGLEKELSDLEGTINNLYETSAEKSKKITQNTAAATSEMAEYYQKQGESALQAAETIEDYDQTLQEAIDDIEKRYRLHKITEAEYYEELERYLKSHANAESELYWEMSDKVTDYYAGLNDTATKTQKAVTKITKEETDNRMELLQKELETQLSEYEKNLSDIQSKINSLADKFTADFKDKFKFETDEKGTFNMKVDEDFIVDKNAELEKYLAQIDNLKKRGISDELLQQLADMTVQEGMKVAEYYQSLTDEQLKNLVNHWNEYNETSRKLAESLYADEVASVTDSYINGVIGKLQETAPELQQAGLTMAQALVSGFDVDGIGAGTLDTLKSHIQKMLSQALNTVNEGKSSQISAAEDSYFDEILSELLERDKMFADAINSSTETISESLSKIDFSLPKIDDVKIPALSFETQAINNDINNEKEEKDQQYSEIINALNKIYILLQKKQTINAEITLNAEAKLKEDVLAAFVMKTVRSEVR